MLKMSLPSRGRGLKFEGHKTVKSTILSLPSRGRGLKYIMLVRDSLQVSVAPFTGAWIEIGQIHFVGQDHRRRSLHGGVD